MIAYIYRFHGHSSLRYVYKNGSTIRRQELTLRFSHNPRRRNPRIAVVVSKKVIKSAVGRNRIRRRIYEQLRLLLPAITPSSDIVCIITNQSLRRLPTIELHRLIVGVLTEAGIYKNLQKNDTIDTKEAK